MRHDTRPVTLPGDDLRTARNLLLWSLLTADAETVAPE